MTISTVSLSSFLLALLITFYSCADSSAGVKEEALGQSVLKKLVGKKLIDSDDYLRISEDYNIEIHIKSGWFHNQLLFRGRVVDLEKEPGDNKMYRARIISDSPMKYEANNNMFFTILPEIKVLDQTKPVVILYTSALDHTTNSENTFDQWYKEE